MSQRRPVVETKSVLQKIKRQRHLTDPAGLVLLLGSSVVMLTFAWLKAGRSPSKQVRGGTLRP